MYMHNNNSIVMLICISIFMIYIYVYIYIYISRNGQPNCRNGALAKTAKRKAGNVIERASCQNSKVEKGWANHGKCIC